MRCSSATRSPYPDAAASHTVSAPPNTRAWSSTARRRPDWRTTLPRAGDRLPSIKRNSVVLPAPLRPTMPHRSPPATLNVTSRKSRVAPNSTPTSERERIVTGRNMATFPSMKVGLVGFAGSGKTTVFNTMTGLAVPTGYGGELRLGTVKVPDERIDALSKIFTPKKTTYAEVVFCDVPGEHGADHKGLSRKALQQIRDQEVLCLVARAFPNPAIEGAADPLADLEAFHTECILADLDIVEKRLDRAKKDKPDPLELGAFELMKETLERELPLRTLPPAALNRDYLKGYGLLTDRPLLVALNRNESEAAQPLPDPIAARLKQLHAAGLVLSASVEAEIAAMAA